MVKKSLKSLCQVGLDFFEFLKKTNRASITGKQQLRDIYNNEFRNRNAGVKDPNFGSVLYALKSSNKVTGRRDNIQFNSNGKVVCEDQWSTSREQRPQPVVNGVANLEILQDFRSGDQAQTGVRARRQLAGLLTKKLKVDRSQLISDKHGISITSDYTFEDGKVTLCEENTYEYKMTLNVKNTGTQNVYFTYYTPLPLCKFLKLFDEHKVTKQNPLLLNPGDSYEVQVHFFCSNFGVFSAKLAFEFKLDSQVSSNTFHIVRFIEAKCITSLGMDLAPIAPFKPRSVLVLLADINSEIVDGQPPKGLSEMKLKYVFRLNQYEVPPYVNQLISSLKKPNPVTDRRGNVLRSSLSWENYKEKFQLLLYLEELQMVVDIKRYNITDEDGEYATLIRDQFNKNLLVMEVPGVSEKRPSVLRGDSLLVYPQGVPVDKKYRGYVHSVQQDSVKLGFSSKFLDIFIKGMKFNVEFTISRLTVRIQHRAVELAAASNLRSVLFPDVNPSTCQKPELPTFRLFDGRLQKNPEQYQAVQHIVAGSSKPAPYLVFGPPGTGKTVTVVEAIKQIEQTQASSHILVCAPSNSATDLLCTKILEHVDPRKVYRMYASNWDPKQVAENQKKCSNLKGEVYVYPAKEELMEYKIIVVTLFTASRFVSGAIPAGHFTHVFVDEAGHAVESECIIPVAGLLDAESGQLVLTGDPKQLGPILRSPFAIKYGMGVSFLERLMSDFPLYQKNEGVYDNRFVTKLLRNYRSHPAILKIPNELFYDGELQACANESRNNYCRWKGLPNPGFPVIFHGVPGADAREANSPSFFNVAEVEVLMDYVRQLLQSQGKTGLAKIEPKDIGIIAPYRKQVQKIRKALDKVGKNFKYPNMNMNELKVGSVEEFQGQEKSIILVSTVRSSSNYMDFDKKFCLGFVKNEKRFNVAVTRAKALMIVVGHPVVLNTDPTWARFIQYCKDEKGYTGFDPSDDDDDDDDDDDAQIDLRHRMLYLSIDGHAETEESVVQQQLDPEWRSDM